MKGNKKRMKIKLWATLFLALPAVLLFGSAVWAEPAEIVTGSFTYRYGDNESLNDAKQTCKDLAVKEALESALIYLKSKVEIGEEGLSKLDVVALSEGCLKDVDTLEKSVHGNTIYYRVQAEVDMGALEANVKNYCRLKARQTYQVSFYRGTINEGLACEKDDSINKAPDTSLHVMDRNGNIVFHSGQKFMHAREVGPLLKNRNSYKPDFQGMGFQYTFSDENDYLEVQLIDFDGVEGAFGAHSSNDDKIGEPYRITTDQFVGKRWVKAKGWQLEIELIACEQAPEK